MVALVSSPSMAIVLREANVERIKVRVKSPGSIGRKSGGELEGLRPPLRKNAQHVNRSLPFAKGRLRGIFYNPAS